MNRAKVEIFCDGSGYHETRLGGVGVILRNSKGQEREFSMGYSNTTTNRMELRAALHGVEFLNVPCDIQLTTDSQYVSKGINERLKAWKARGWKASNGSRLYTPPAFSHRIYRPKPPKLIANYDLWQRLDALLANHTIVAHWIKGHNGHPENERCDKLAGAAFANGPYAPDTNPNE